MTMGNARSGRPAGLVAHRIAPSTPRAVFPSQCSTFSPSGGRSTVRKRFRSTRETTSTTRLAFTKKYADMAMATAAHVHGWRGVPGRSAWNAISARVMPTTNWLTLKAIFSGAHLLASWPTRTPAATAKVSTLGWASGRAAAHRASVREKFTVSVRCRSGIENCSATAMPTVRAAKASTSFTVHDGASARRTPRARAAAAAVERIRRRAEIGTVVGSTIVQLHTSALQETALQETALHVVPLQERALQETALHPGVTAVSSLQGEVYQAYADQDMAGHGCPRASISPTTWNDPLLASSEPVPVDGTRLRLAGMTPFGFLAAWRALPTSTMPAPAPWP